MPDYIFINGQRLTPWMAYVIRRLDADLHDAFGVHVRVISGIRTYQEQAAIFRLRYVTGGNIRGRRVYDTRTWNGQLWYRIDPLGTVAQPGTSNHEIQGNNAAVDIQDTGDANGITVKNSARGRWIRAWCKRTGLMVAEGDSFAEGWHYKIPGIFRTPPTASGGTPAATPATPVPEEEEDDMSKNIIYKTTNTDTTSKGQYPLRFAVTNDTSGLWIEAVDKQAGTMNVIATRYQTGDAIEVSPSMFNAARAAAAQIRPRSELTVTVGNPDN